MSKFLPENVRPLRGFYDKSTAGGRRLRANWPAELRFDGVRLRCSVIDISPAGACVRVERMRDPTSQGRLVVADLLPIVVEVAWRRQNHVGLRFIEAQHWVADACAERFDPAAWLKRKDTKKDLT